MTKPNDILIELTELQSLFAQQTRKPVYQAPAGYFDELPAQILNRVKAMDSKNAAEELAHLSTLLSQAPKINPYTVPVDYFTELDATVHMGSEKSASDEIADLSPLLGGLKKQAPFQVPAGYFESLSSVVLAEEKKPAGKVISMTNRSWIRYAAAAVVTGFVVLSTVFLLNKKETIDPDTKSFAWVEKNMKKVSTEDINEFVEFADEEKGAIAKATAPDEIKNLLNDVDDKEIQDFLNDTQIAESDNEDELFN